MKLTKVLHEEAKCTRLQRLMRSALILIGILAILFSATGKLNAQALASITGTVTDTSGAVVANANVTVTNDATNVSKTTASSSAGSYTVTDLIPGTYTVKVESPGFQTPFTTELAWKRRTRRPWMRSCKRETPLKQSK